MSRLKVLLITVGLLFGISVPAVLVPGVPGASGQGLRSLHAQETGDGSPQAQDVALLVRGPEAGRGLPFLRSNVIDYYLGTYIYLEKKILLYYTEKEIVRYGSWESADCSGTRLYGLDEALMERYRSVLEASNASGTSGTAGTSSAGTSGTGAAVPGTVFFYEDDEFYLFFVFEDELNCTFVQRFLTRFSYFRSVRDLPSKRPPFPAVVD